MDVSSSSSSASNLTQRKWKYSSCSFSLLSYKAVNRTGSLKGANLECNHRPLWEQIYSKLVENTKNLKR